MNAPSQTLRVAIVASSLKLAGAEKQTFYMARALHRAGQSVRFYHLGGDGHYEPALRQSGVAVHRIYFPGQPWRMLARLTKSLFQWRPQIVLAVQFGDLRYAIPAGRICQALVLGGVRSDGFYELNRYGRWSRWLLRWSHGLITNSRHARQNLLSQNVSPQKIEVLPNVIDLPDFDARSARLLAIALPANRVIAAAVGNLHACKRFDRFLAALALARRDAPELTGVIAGADCGVKTALQTRAGELGLTPRDLIFLGAFDEVPALLARSAMLVLTSDYEGFPNVILEAMAARLPVISVPAGDAGLIVRPDKTGRIVAAEDVRSMADFMVQLVQCPRLRLRLGKAGRNCVEQEFNCEPLAERLLAVFHRFASRQPRRSLCELLERGVAANHSAPVSGAGNFARSHPIDSNPGMPANGAFTFHS